MKLLLIITLLLVSFTPIQSQFFKNDPTINADQEILKKHVDILGSDLFEGRGTGTKGGELAANYISSIYSEIGLKPVGDDGTYFQSVPLHGTNILDESKLVLLLNNDTINLVNGEDYLLSNLGEQTFIPRAIDLVYVGYGIIAPEYDHNDYLGKDITGKIAVILDGEPASNEFEYFNGDEPTIYSHIEAKHRIAISRGAEGTIILPESRKSISKYWEKMVSEYSFEDVKLSYNASSSFGVILNPLLVEGLFYSHSENSKSGLNVNESLVNRFKLKFEGQFFVRDFKSNNIVGLIEGNKKKNDNEFIIISAHYDHLGIGPSINGDKIYNGVLDNALGVSSLLEVARILYGYKDYLGKSVVFIATTAEEKGLLGATYYVDNPIFPLYKTVANINIDGVAFLDEFTSIIGVGAELSNLNKYLKRMSSYFDISVKKIPKEFYSNEAFNRSDQIAFAKAGIPSVLILDSPEYMNMDRKTAIEKIIYYNEEIYHSPFDDLSINLNYNAIAKHTNIISAFAFELANINEEITWNVNVPYRFIRLQSIAEKR